MLAERQVLECQIRVRLERGTHGAEEGEHEGHSQLESFSVFPSSSPAILFLANGTQATFGWPNAPHQPKRSATAEMKESPRASRKNTELKLDNPSHHLFICGSPIGAELDVRRTERYGSGSAVVMTFSSGRRAVQAADLRGGPR